MAGLPKDQQERAPWVISAETSDELRQRYDLWADTYDADLEDVDAYRAPQMVSDKLVEFGAPDGEVLDIACGTGFAGRRFTKLGSRISPA